MFLSLLTFYTNLLWVSLFVALNFTIHQNKNKGKEFYIYCLVDIRNDKDEIFYIGKGKGQRVFNHEKAAFNKKLELLLESEDKTEDLKINKIRAIKAEGFTINKVILNYWLSEREAFASENTLINLFNNNLSV